MKTLRYALPFLGFILLMIASYGCDQSPTATDKVSTADSLTSVSKTQQAYTEMETQMYAASKLSINSSNDLDIITFAKANSLYKEAVTANPNNPEANFGAALTEIFGTYADPDIRDAVKRWENFTPNQNTSLQLLRFNIPTGTKDMTVPTAALARNLFKMMQLATTDPPTISQMQSLLNTKFLPRIDYAIARLAIVEQNQSYRMKITGKMMGDPNLSAVYLDLTEVYVMDAMVQGMKSLVEEFLVYQFDLPAYTTAAVVTAINQTNTTFFVLASDGKTHATNSKNAILGMIGKIRSGINFLKSVTGDQSNNIIKIQRGNQSGIQESDLDTVLTYLTRAENTLASTTSFTITNWGTDNRDYTVQVNLRQFFDNPPTNPKKDWLPAYTVDTTAHGDIQMHWQAQTYSTFIFPDPTLSGIFPGMTSDNLKKLLYIDESFAWQLSFYLYDNNVQTPYTSTSAQIVVNGITYLPNTTEISYSWYNYYSKTFRFYILENDGMSADAYAVINGLPVKLDLSRPLNVHLKNYDYLDANVSAAPQNISAGAQSSVVTLSLNTSDPLIIERDGSGTGTGVFVVIDSTQWSSYYYDSKVTSGKTYRYRVRPYAASNYYYDYYAVRQNNYSNTVTVTVP